MPLPLIIGGIIAGFAGLVGVSWLTVAFPTFNMVLWAVILFGLAVALSWIGVGSIPIYEGERFQIKIVSLLIVPALALILLAIAGINISNLLPAIGSISTAVNTSSATGGGVSLAGVTQDTFNVVALSIGFSFAGGWLNDQLKLQKRIEGVRKK